jgi:LacI family transcriptional regulator
VDAGVSIPTVSRVINGSGPVAERTRKAVLGSIQRLGYHPNPMARGLSRGRSDAVLVILPHITEPSVTMRLGGLIRVLNDTPYELHIVDVEQPIQERLRPLGDIVNQNRPAGVIIISLRPSESDLHRFRESRIPVVMIDVMTTDFPCDAVDDVAGGELATRHLIDLGHAEVGFIGDDEDTAIGAPASADRRHGFQRALEQAGLPVRPEFVATVAHGTDPARVAAEKMLSREPRPTAIFAASDVQAFGALAAARNVGLSVPGELSVIGFDDISLAEFIGLTTVRQPLLLSGERAGLRLLQALGHQTDDAIPASPELEVMVRHTTAAPASRNERSLSSPEEGGDLVMPVSDVPEPATGGSGRYQGGSKEYA